MLDKVPYATILVWILANLTFIQQDKLRTMIMDCLTPPAWELGYSTSLVPCSDPTGFWAKFAAGFVLPPDVRETIGKELRSSYEWQRVQSQYQYRIPLSTLTVISYEHSPRCPDWNSNRLAWEQSLVSGHPTHPVSNVSILRIEKPNYARRCIVLEFCPS